MKTTAQRWTLAVVWLPTMLGCLADSNQTRDSEIPAWQAARQLEFLTAACAEPLQPGNMNSALVHLTCDERLPGYDLPDGALPDDAWDHVFEKMWRLRDTSDFDMNRIMHLLYDFRGHAAASEALWLKTEQAVLDFKYWYTDPTPARTVDGEPVIDTMWYWSENHIMIFRVAEYLAGQMFPGRRFTVSGLTGREHRTRARNEIMRWLDERARWGFTEWHSDVYYNWDMQPLLALIEFANDEELATRAAMVLDLVWLDVALHLHRGNMGSTHGRSYIKDKAAAPTQNIFDGAKLYFADTDMPYASLAGTNGVAFARAKRYALPQAIREIARDDTPMEDRQRMNLDIDERPPTSANAPIAPAPHGLDYEDDTHLPFWWSMNAMTTWPLLAKTYEVAERLNLWEAQFEPMKIVRDLLGPYRGAEKFREAVFPIYNEFWSVITEPLLKEVNTYTYRTAHYMLSAAQSYRPGIRSNQTHIWQATLDERAVVFTTHPGTLPPTGVTNINWQDEDEPGPGYWTGQGALPRVGAYKNVLVSIYAPAYLPRPLGLDFDYRDETHAYFPVAHFDEVTAVNRWTFGRKGDSYVALYSHRPVTWRTGTPDVFENGDLPFDLVAAGGPDNLWLVELGDAESAGSFGDFIASIAAADIDVAATPNTVVGDIRSVSYNSPSQGLVEFSWTGDLRIAGQVIALSDYPRLQNPFVEVGFDETRYDIAHGDERLVLDFVTGLREFTTP